MDKTRKETTKGRPCKYLTVEEWEKFKGNHWRHLVWKVNGLMAGGMIIVGLLVAILFGVVSLVRG